MHLNRPARLMAALVALATVFTAFTLNMVTGGKLAPVRSPWWPLFIVLVVATLALALEHSGDEPLPSRPKGSPDHTGAEEHVFLCHATADASRVSDLYDKLIEAGIRPWMAKRDLSPGQDWELEIKRAQRLSRIIVVLLSTRAISHKGYIQKEIREALDLAALRPPGEVFLIPALLEPCEVPERLRDLHWVELYRRGGRQRLITAILRDVGKAPLAPKLNTRTRLVKLLWRSHRWMLAGAASIALTSWLLAVAFAPTPNAGPDENKSVECEKGAFPIEPGERITSMTCKARYALVQLEGDANVKGTQSVIYRATNEGWELVVTGSTTHGAISCGDIEGAGLGHENIPALFEDYPFLCPDGQ